MGDEVIRGLRTFAAAGALAASAAAGAQEAGELDGPAVGADLFYSTDADETEVLRAGLDFDLRHLGPEDYLGIRLEKARYNPVGSGWRDMERVYLRAARAIGKWKASARVGTDGETVVGAATIHDEAKFRKEFFVERDIVETRRGVDEGIYYTFAGAAIDLPINERNIVTLVGGLQEFTGDNVRSHIRANFVHVLDPEQGLSLQLRTRYFRNSHPGEYDYYSPRWYAQAVPILQLRRFAKGWRYLLAGGVGVQRDANTDWRRSSYLNAQVQSPERSRWSVNAALLFSETPTTAGNSYNYFQANVGVRRRF